MKKERPIITVGWREWCALPELNITHIKAKIDTGAATSCLHAIHIEPYKKGNQDWVCFETHPLQRNTKTTIECHAPLLEQRHIKSSTGHIEHRYVIETMIQVAGRQWPIHMSLTTREMMSFRMLLGREAMRGKIVVNPAKSYLTSTT